MNVTLLCGRGNKISPLESVLKPPFERGFLYIGGLSGRL